MRDFWLVEQSDLQEAGFTAEQIALFTANLRQLDGSSGSTNGPPRAAPGSESLHREPESALEPSASGATTVPVRLLQNLQAYFPELEVAELERALRNMDFNFGKALSLLTELYPQHRVMEPHIADNILLDQKEGGATAATGGESTGRGAASHSKIGKFPVPPAAVENLSRQFPGIAVEEVEEALRQNRLNFVKSVEWLQMRHPGTRIRALSCLLRVV